MAQLMSKFKMFFLCASPVQSTSFFIHEYDEYGQFSHTPVNNCVMVNRKFNKLVEYCYTLQTD